eukprot:scaffold7977_cov128-Isochrysis_galbana.AAC.4
MLSAAVGGSESHRAAAGASAASAVPSDALRRRTGERARRPDGTAFVLACEFPIAQAAGAARLPWSRLPAGSVTSAAAVLSSSVRLACAWPWE